MSKEMKRAGAKFATWRRVSVGAVLLVCAIGFIWHTGTGTLSSIGWQDVYLLCPLGALEALCGSWGAPVRALVALAAVVVLVVVFGRAFCGWVCPVPPLQRFFKGKRAKAADAKDKAEAAQLARSAYEQGTCAKRTPAGVDSRHVVLAGALGSAALFGFPVFCLVCPVGLTFALMIGLVRLVGFNEPSWSLVIFACVLLVELVCARKWCHKFCPMGALLSLVGQLNRTFRPSVNAEKCLRAKGEACGVCAAACPEQVDPHSDLGVRSLAECTRCGDCAVACPAAAISFPLFRQQVAEVTTPGPGGVATGKAPGASEPATPASPEAADVVA